jgi:hypothetical protein
MEAFMRLEKPRCIREERKNSFGCSVKEISFFPLAGAPSGAVNPAIYATLYRCTLPVP